MEFDENFEVPTSEPPSTKPAIPKEKSKRKVAAVASAAEEDLLPAPESAELELKPDESAELRDDSQEVKAGETEQSKSKPEQEHQKQKEESREVEPPRAPEIPAPEPRASEDKREQAAAAAEGESKSEESGLGTPQADQPDSELLSREGDNV